MAAMRERLRDGPALVHWVVRVDSVDEIADPLELSRGGNRWVIGVPPDGRMPTHGGLRSPCTPHVPSLSGLAPSRILWRTPPPSTLLPDKGIRLRQLVLATREPAAVTAVVAGIRGPIVVMEGPPGLSATFDTPTGPVKVEHLQ